MRAQIQPAIHMRGALIAQEILQIEMRRGVEAIARLTVASTSRIKPHWLRNTVAVTTQLQNGHIKKTTIKGYQRRLPVRLPAFPECPRNNVRTKLRTIQRDNINQRKILRHLGNRNRHRQLKRMRNEITFPARFFHQLSALFRHRLLWRQLFQVRIAHPLDQPAISHGFDVKDEVRWFVSFFVHGGEVWELSR